jgi:hypothetical protein
VRRLLPWALLVLIGIGAGLGAAVGAAGAHGAAGPTPQEWVDAVLARTEAAGTAHLEYAAVTASPDPVLRGSAAGRGVVDFTAGTFRISEVQHQDDWTIGPGGQIHPHAETIAQSAIAIGPAVYLSLGPTNVAGWAKESIPRDQGGLGLDSAAGFSGALSWLSPPFAVRSVQTLRTASLGAPKTTRYLVRSSFRADCPKGTSQAGQTVERTTVWIDGQGRLVRASDSVFTSGRLPAAVLKDDPILASRPKGSLTQHNTLRLSAFGSPVHVTPPAATVNDSFGSSVALRARCTS